MNPIWQNRSSTRPPRAPSPFIARQHNNLTPRQVAHKTYAMTVRKLDQDAKRSRPKYQVRERLLLCHTMTDAERILYKRTLRTNRRVMALEEEDDAGDLTTTPASQGKSPAEFMHPLHSEQEPLDHHQPMQTHTTAFPPQPDPHPFALPPSHRHASMDPMEVSIAMIMEQHMHQHQHQQDPYHPPSPTSSSSSSSSSSPPSPTSLYYSPPSSNSIIIPNDMSTEDFSIPYSGAMSITIPANDNTCPSLPLNPSSQHLPHSSTDAFIIPQDDEDDLPGVYPSSLIIPHLAKSQPTSTLHVPPISSI
ncbi:hypothetical protein DM01DRAFT_1332343 [Hesseltinella vesiculosa]|uniref:Uncharacterized protein n=1 Tax=Hesseltinella vesiculosa TaxID=101127 RepID=A0A1X2GUQ0_9FUNG|nr:hypothetical protein DM01DRAFT_1332343 [Hesseltinella vesiculosa]